MSIFSLKIDDIVTVKIEGLENEGCGVAKINGMIVFIPKALVGEKVKIRITEIKKNFARGKVIDIIDPSLKRIKSNCPYYEECGGCNLRHQSDAENLKFKKEKVEIALRKIGKIEINVDDVIQSPKNDNYRNKASFKLEKDKIGFYSSGSYQLVDIENCRLLENEINDCLYVIRNYIKQNKNNVIKEITIKRGNALGEILINVYSLDDSDIGIVNYLIENVNNIKTIIYNEKVVFGNGYIGQITNGLMFNCSYNSFFQVNSMQTENLYSTAIKLAKLNKNDVVMDLYCGTGTIASILSSYVKKVIGVEIVENAIIDAKENLKINNINNVSFICSDVTKAISKIKEKIDVIFVDPPRKGIDRKAIAIIKKINPKKIIYISCNPVTMARDLSYLNDLYNVEKVTPVDMFPKTAHVECVSVLYQKKSRK